MHALARQRPIVQPPIAAEPERDPVCGMVVSDGDAPRTTHDGRDNLFCSEACRLRFLADPERFTTGPRSPPAAR